MYFNKPFEIINLLRFKPRCYVFGVAFTTLGFLAGCSPTRNLAENERLLYKINLEGLDQADKSAISNLYQQKPNRKVLGSPFYLNIYYLGKQFYNPEKTQRKIDGVTAGYNRRITKAGSDSVRVDKLIEKKENKLAKLQNRKENGNWLMRTVGEPPAIFDSLKMVQTADQIRIYLHSKGFFKSAVATQVEEQKKKMYVTFNLTEGPITTVSQHTYNVPDSALFSIVQANTQASLIKSGQNYDEDLISQERTRLEQLLKNNGYYDFRQQYITFEADTSFEANTVRLATLIANPNDSSLHKVYTINNVNFIMDAGVNRFGVKRDTTVHNGIFFLAYRRRFSPRILDRKVSVRPGQKYSAARTLETQQLLSNLDMFRYTSLNYTKHADSLKTNAPVGFLDAQINTSPLPRYQETSELGGTFTERLPGPYASLRLRIRNVFGGAELLDMGLRAGYEGQLAQTLDASGSQVVGRRTEIGVDAGLTFPQFLVPFRTNRFFAQYNPRTRISTGYTYVARPEYTRTNLNLSLDYIWQKRNVHQFSFSPLDVDIVSTPKISAFFDELLTELENQGNPLRQSFNSAFVSSINFTSLYNTANYNQTNNAKLVRIFGEAGGFISQLFADNLTGLRNYKFVKGLLDYRRYLPQGNNIIWVYRGSVGAVKPIAGNVLPYDKYFFAGGSSSVRAWLPRRLGPGSSTRVSNSTGEISYNIEQPGEILLELNSELRFKMFQFGATAVNGALFVDAGNVWTFNERVNVLEENTGTPSNWTITPGGQFAFDRFYKEIAVGTGFGVRLDFNFAILRFDIATKVLDPAQPDGERFVLGRFKASNIFSNGNQTTFNLGIGYPF